MLFPHKWRESFSKVAPFRDDKIQPWLGCISSISCKQCDIGLKAVCTHWFTEKLRALVQRKELILPKYLSRYKTALGLEQLIFAYKQVQNNFKREIICKSYPSALWAADLIHWRSFGSGSVSIHYACLSNYGMRLVLSSRITWRFEPPGSSTRQTHEIKPCAKLTLFHLISASTSSGNPASSLLFTSLVLSSSQLSRLLISFSSRSASGKASRNA